MEHRSLRVMAALVALGAVPLLGPAAQAAETAPDGPRVRLVVVADGAGEAARVAGRLDGLADQGLEVVDPAPAGRALTIEVPAASAASLVAQVRGTTDVAEVVPETTYTLFDYPDDPIALEDQWASINAVDLPSAWDVTHGSASVVVAVIDTGVAVNHPDLAAKVVGTYNATDGGGSVADAIGHGTMVASIAAADTDNGVGIAGSGWDTSILAVKVADSAGVITNASVADGIDWAVAHGADVINLSLGSATDDAPVRDAVARAVAADVVVVAAAGNNGTSSKFYPAALPNVLAVGATTNNGSSRASFSQYGSWVDVGAPGVTMSGANADYPTEVDYVSGDGTSFASPFVAGAVALVRASRPDLDEASVRDAITSTATSQSFGFAHGLLDVFAALGADLVLPGPTVASPLPGATVAGTVPVDVTVPSGVVADHVKVQLVGGGPSVTAALTAGHAVADLPTFGSYGPDTLRVVLCRQSLCSLTGTDVPVTVSNPAPSLTSPADGTRALVGFTVSATDTGPSVRFLADGSTVLGTDVAAPFSVSVAISDLTPGPHTLTAVGCDAAGTWCATDHPSAAISIMVARLSPTIGGLTPTPFSPDGDGVKDATTLTYSLDVASDVTISVLRPDDSSFYSVHLGALPAGTHTWTWHGHDSARNLVTSGTYRVAVDTSATVSAEVLIGHAARSLVVDMGDPRLSSAATTYPTVYPVKDGYRDSTNLSVVVSEPLATFKATVRNGAGKAVWSATKTKSPAGRVALGFSGHATSGAVLPAGTYTFSFTAVDAAGNSTTTAGRHVVAVSAKQLSGTRTATKTLTGETSFDVWFTDDSCSGLYLTPWAPGALRWDACDGGSVLSWHHLTLPAAAVYGSVRVGAYARGSSGAQAYFRYLNDDDTYGTGVHFGEREGTHWGPTVPITSHLLEGHQVRWSMLVENGDAYAAKTFTVTWTYRVLV